MINANEYTSKTASRLIFMPSAQEPNAEELKLQSVSGILIGNSFSMNVPVFLDFNQLFNPHVFIVGMTGSGKTYLMKSMLIRLCLIMDAAVLMIDLTGEYEEISKAIGTANISYHSTGPQEEIDLSKTTYVSMNEMKEEEKIEFSSKILREIAVKMRKNATNGTKRTFVLLDESWKLLSKNDDLETIVREGRKYGVGLILASQLLEDMRDEIVSNSASIFIFRIQMKKSAEKAALDYGLGQQHMDMVQTLNQGSCLFIKLDKNNKRSIAVVKRVTGIAFNPKKILRIGAKMEVEIDTDKLQSMMCRLCGPEESKKALSYITTNADLRLSGLIQELIECGADRRAILSEFRKLRINEHDIADAFSEAISMLSKEAVYESF